MREQRACQLLDDFAWFVDIWYLGTYSAFARDVWLSGHFVFADRTPTQEWDSWVEKWARTSIDLYVKHWA